MNNFDYYAAARSLIAQLTNDGYLAEASRLHAAVEGGATGTEILMALRFHLEQIIQHVPLRGESQIRASELLVELSDVLQ
jgi:hypothetical protein